MGTKIKNIEKAEVFKMQDEVQYQDGQVVSKTLSQNQAVSRHCLPLKKERKSAPTNQAVMRWQQFSRAQGNLP